MSYTDFLRAKQRAHRQSGIDVDGDIHPALFPWQREIVRWSLRMGKSALFEDCGLGKTIQSLAWASHVPGRVLIVCPLAVSAQTKAEGGRFGIDVGDIGSGSKIEIINYESMHLADWRGLAGVVLDESSILKSTDGRYRNDLIARCQNVPFVLACTATPAPNDHVELGSHAEIVGASTRAEMLARYFTHDNGETQTWRLKGHARAEFWRWVASWASMVRTPADLGFDATGYVLPELRTHISAIDVDTPAPEGQLFAMEVAGIADIRRERRESMGARVDAAAALANGPGQWLVWCELNDEGNALATAIDGAEQVSGSTPPDVRADRMLRFASGELRVLVTKPKIAGFGMNWQNCAQMVFVGLSHSWEQYYQAIRRCWRFGQRAPVDVHIITTTAEYSVVRTIQAKQAAADEMAAGMVEAMRSTTLKNLKGITPMQDAYNRKSESGNGWDMHLGDCVEIIADIPDGSVDFSVFSPPFASLYTYSPSDRDMGNCSDDSEFFEHYGFLASHIHRILRPGRLVSVHCMDLPKTKERDGVIGMRDFRGAIVRAMEDAGFIYHSCVTIWKDPVVAMQRTKAIGLLYKQLRKDSALSRQGFPDYLVTFRKDGINTKPITHDSAEFPVDLWQRYASPVWMDIDQGDTLQRESAREHDDERHICPLQLGVINRALELWSAPGDVVFSPFAGIGSEGKCALDMGRRFIGCELKQSYFNQAVLNLANAGKQMGFGF